MASRIGHSKLLLNLPVFSRRLNTAASPSTTAAAATVPQANFTGDPNPFDTKSTADDPTDLFSSTVTIRLNTAAPPFITAAVPQPNFIKIPKTPVSLDDPEELPPVKSIDPTTAGSGGGSGGGAAVAGGEPPINLDDPRELFSSVPTSKLIKSTVTLHMASMDSMVDMGSWVLKSGLMQNPISKGLVLGSIKHTFYEHFCGGKDLKEADNTVKRIWDDYGLRAMLDYGMEHALDNGSCDSNLDEFIQTIQSATHSPTSPVSFVVVKITAICPPSLLKRVSDLLRWEHKDKSMHLPWKRESFPIFSDSTALYHTPQMPPPLTPKEENDLDLAYKRLVKICDKSLEANLPMLIDAEDTLIQPAIDYFAYCAAIKYRRAHNIPLIFNTIQAYLKDARERLVIAKISANKMGVPLGVKLVRGAYMSSERKLAFFVGAESPIHETIQDTHACFNSCASFMLEEIAKGSGSLVLATHNIESGKLAAAKAVELGLEKDNENLEFAQLYGMAQALSFGLRNAGFKVSKYVPFGPVEQIMPYLLRRAEENRGLLSTSSLDRQLMRKELVRRIIS
ncbi:hypothetical protein ABFS82_11G093800 [Erythranthe guttata]|uniref:Proline dehydrogenase n=2 Tax=Erythranthe guttata TaxID=4155 RepID=A0A022RKE0_ERYGU|nr:hypothetical protein MIMGU_mgv1a003788mg [Erythranthe guttata]